jgi:hypothetical protein
MEFKMEIDRKTIDGKDGANAERFREYAAECRRLARTASEKDRSMLIELAEAWMVCAEQAERNGKHHRQG